MECDGAVKLWQQQENCPPVRVIFFASWQKIFGRFPKPRRRNGWVPFDDDLVAGEKFAIIVGNRELLVERVPVVVKKSLALTKFVKHQKANENRARPDYDVSDYPIKLLDVRVVVDAINKQRNYEGNAKHLPCVAKRNFHRTCLFLCTNIHIRKSSHINNSIGNHSYEERVGSVYGKK